MTLQYKGFLKLMSSSFLNQYFTVDAVLIIYFIFGPYTHNTSSWSANLFHSLLFILSPQQDPNPPFPCLISLRQTASPFSLLILPQNNVSLSLATQSVIQLGQDHTCPRKRSISWKSSTFSGQDWGDTSERYWKCSSRPHCQLENAGIGGIFKDPL